MFFGTMGNQRPNFDGFIYIHYAAPSYSARINAIYLLPFGKVWLVPFYVCPVLALNFESLDLELSFMAHRYMYLQEI